MTFLKVTKRLSIQLTLMHFTAATAQTAPDAGSLRQQIERDRLPTVPSVVSPQTSTEQKFTRSSTDAVVVVTAFRFTGNTLFSSSQLSAAGQAYLHRPINFSELQEAAASIASVYRNAGWVVQLLLPSQDIQDGIVTIQVFEATFAGVKLEGKAASRIATNQLVGIVGAQQTTGALLNAQAVDRALLIASDVPGVTVTGSLRPGALDNETELAVTVADKAFITFYTVLDNTGSRATGSNRLAVNFGLASPFGVGDQISFSSSRTEGSAYQRVSTTLPLGYSGLRIGANTSHLNYKVVSPELLALNVTGISDSAGVEAIYPLVRTLVRNLYFSVQHDSKRFNNLADGAVTTRYKSDTFGLQLNGNMLDSAGGVGITSANLLLVKGDINLNGSPNESADALTTQTAGRFTKLRYALSRQQAVSDSANFFVSLSGQHAGKNLDSSEKFSIGGSSGVRAYPSGEGSGALAQLINLELRWRLPQGIEWTGFYDYGRLKVNKNNGFSGASNINAYHLEGAGISLAVTSIEGATFKATLAKRIKNNPFPTDTGKDQDGSLNKYRWWLSFSLPL